MRQIDKTHLNPKEKNNPVVLDQINRQVALILLKELPPLTFGRAIIDSSMRSILQTSFYEIGHQLKLSPTYFSSIHGATLTERLILFAKTITANSFMLSWFIAQTAVLIGFPIQLLGMYCLFLKPTGRPLSVLLLLSAMYFLAINLSFGNPKYGLPLNPVKIVLLVAGTQHLVSRRFKSRVQPSANAGAY